MKIRVSAATLLLAGIFLTSAAASPTTEGAPKKESKATLEPSKPVFFPPAPEEPRIQFLKSFSLSTDFEKPVSGFKKFIVGDSKDVREITKPYGVAVHEEKIYVCDSVQNAIVILDFRTREFRFFEPQGDVPLMEPLNVDFDSTGKMYVADARRGQVLIFGPDDAFIGAIGKSSEFKPTDVMIKNEKIYVCDLKSNLVKVFSLKDHTFLADIPAEDATDEVKLFSPTNIASDEAGNIYVSDVGAFRVQKYSPQGQFLQTFGSHGDGFGQFARPKGLAVGTDGNIFVVDAAFENVQIFDPAGNVLLFFGGPAEKREISLVLPATVALDSTLIDYFKPLISPDFQVESLVLVTSQYGARKINVFGFGHKKA